ncbi:MAG TPA: ATP-binding protein [Stellaceae bacterium]|nr:ATP-binding protein [Stellaceae bacterium]
MLIVSLVAIAVGCVGLLSYLRSSEQVAAITGERLQVIAQNRQVLLNDYIDDASRQLEIFADNPATAFVMSSFTSSYMAIDGDVRAVLQHAFIERATIPIDQRGELGEPDDGSLYAASHTRFHPSLRLTADAAKVADLYLIDRQGEIIYTVQKSADFAASLADPTLVDGPLSAVHARAMAAADALAFSRPGMPDKPGMTTQDFQFHVPIREPAMFIGRAVKTESGRVIGTAVFRLSNTLLKTIMQDPTGLARTGDAILVGPDGLLRSESRLSNGSSTLLTKVEGSEAATRALSGASGTMLGDDHLGRPALLAYQPISLGGQRVALIVSLENEEAFATARHLAKELAVTAIASLIIIALAGILYARSITRPLGQMAGLMQKLAGGDAGVAVVGAARGDEIGAMARAVEVFKRNAAEVQRLSVEQERHRAETKVQELRHHFDMAIDSTRQAIALFDTEDRLVACNAPYVDLHKDRSGKSPERSSIIGLTFQQALEIRLDTGIYGDVDDREQFIADRLIRFHGISDCAVILLSDGRWMQIDNRHTPDETVINVWTDITTLKAAEAQQRALEMQLQHSQRLEALGTMAGGIAHDLNNTLVPILGLTQLMGEMLPETGGEREILGVIVDAATRAKGLVRQILAFSRKEQGHRKVFDFAALVREALTMTRSAIPATIQIDHNIQDIPLVDGDEGQFHQVLVNLITNAAQAIGSGTGGVITITLGPAPDDPAAIRLTVQDSGCGMDEATRARIFEPFFTTKPVNEGTGLGLSVVHGIVSAHGGTISVASEPGQGCVFAMTLPIARENSEADTLAA